VIHPGLSGEVSNSDAARADTRSRPDPVTSLTNRGGRLRRANDDEKRVQALAGPDLDLPVGDSAPPRTCAPTVRTPVGRPSGRAATVARWRQVGSDVRSTSPGGDRLVIARQEVI
jgi:hypothetical protein